jgi:Peptidase S46
MKSSAVFLLLSFAVSSTADEGMWLFDRFPHDAVNQKYGIDASAGFLDSLRLASVRIGGAAGAFVSPAGLLLTNQHVVSACLAKLSSNAHDYLNAGFYAASAAEELRCPDLDAKVLMSIEDITPQVPVPPKKGANAKTTQQREAAITRIQSECAGRSHEICEVVNLFAGSRYDLYRYKQYTDIRLVFAPEQQLAFFGRERDSITYLRYGLDVAFARAYEDGKPAATPHFLKWSNAALKEGDLVFAAGNPRTTIRETTAAQLTFYRDTALPLELARLGKRIAALSEFEAKSEDNRRLAEPQRTLFLEAYKSAAGKLIGLRDDRLVSRKTIFDGKIRRAVEADAKLGTEAAKVWDQVATAYKNWAPNEKAYQLLEAAPAPGSNLFRVAREFVRGQAAMGEAGRGTAGEMDIEEPLEITFLTQYLEELKNFAEHGGKDVPLKAVLSGRMPQAAAEAFVHSSHLNNTGARRRLSMNQDAIANSEDGMIHLVQLLEPAADRIRKKHEEIIGAVEATAAAQIAEYRYRLFGDAQYPDATGTPRVEYGVLRSYTDRAGVNEPYAATFSGLYYRRNNQGPYQVPQRWVDSMPLLNVVTPLDFVSTCDIGGGDAGSPTVNRAGELVGILFDGNLESLPNTYLYTDEQARAVHVAAQGIVEALEKVYRADALLKELGVQRGSKLDE